MRIETHQAETWRVHEIVQRMVLLSRLKADPFADLDKDDVQLETNEVAKDEEDEN